MCTRAFLFHRVWRLSFSSLLSFLWPLFAPLFSPLPSSLSPPSCLSTFSFTSIAEFPISLISTASCYFFPFKFDVSRVYAFSDTYFIANNSVSLTPIDIADIWLPCSIFHTQRKEKTTKNGTEMVFFPVKGNLNAFSLPHGTKTVFANFMCFFLCVTLNRNYSTSFNQKHPFRTQNFSHIEHKSMGLFSNWIVIKSRNNGKNQRQMEKQKYCKRRMKCGNNTKLVLKIIFSSKNLHTCNKLLNTS